jgi:hypothetical protein
MDREHLSISQETFLTAAHTLVDYPGSEFLLGRFLYTYEHKRQFPWLVESGQVPGEDLKGISGAVKMALAYHRMSGQLTDPEGTTPVTAQYRTDLHEAFEAVSRDDFSLRRFAHRLSPSVLIFRGDIVPIAGRNQEWAGLLQVVDNPKSRYEMPADLRNITLPQMIQEIAISLESYWQHHNQGLSADPW